MPGRKRSSWNSTSCCTEKQLNDNDTRLLQQLLTDLRHKSYSKNQQTLAELLQFARETRVTDVRPGRVGQQNEFPLEVVSAYTARMPTMRRFCIASSKRELAPPYRVEDTRQLDLADRVVAWGLANLRGGADPRPLHPPQRTGWSVPAAPFYLALPPLPGCPITRWPRASICS